MFPGLNRRTGRAGFTVDGLGRDWLGVANNYYYMLCLHVRFRLDHPPVLGSSIMTAAPWVSLCTALLRRPVG